ncbi:unnamed protein product [Linum trigynum]|uniref:Secreted protein n=1 Tax=Linum trigynum TaxID=586398 RepID=A0AAV2EKL9_9ROSI
MRPSFITLLLLSNAPPDTFPAFISFPNQSLLPAPGPDVPQNYAFCSWESTWASGYAPENVARLPLESAGPKHASKLVRVRLEKLLVAAQMSAPWRYVHGRGGAK